MAEQATPAAPAFAVVTQMHDRSSDRTHGVGLGYRKPVRLIKTDLPKSEPIGGTGLQVHRIASALDACHRQQQPRDVSPWSISFASSQRDQ
jgi:hypothetical protein